MKKHDMMKKFTAAALSLTMMAGLAGWLTRDGTQLYSQVITKPPLSPPSIVFPIVWVILFALMGIGAARVYLAPPSGLRSRSLLLFLVQLAFNFFWSIIFFQFQKKGVDKWERGGYNKPNKSISRNLRGR